MGLNSRASGRLESAESWFLCKILSVCGSLIGVISDRKQPFKAQIRVSLHISVAWTTDRGRESAASDDYQWGSGLGVGETELQSHAHRRAIGADRERIEQLRGAIAEFELVANKLRNRGAL